MKKIMWILILTLLVTNKIGVNCSESVCVEDKANGQHCIRVAGIESCR